MAINSLADLLRSDDPEMLRAPVVARILDVRLQKVYEQTRAGKLPHVRIAQSIRYPSHKLREYIEQMGTPYRPGDDQ